MLLTLLLISTRRGLITIWIGRQELAPLYERVIYGFRSSSEHLGVIFEETKI